MARSGSVGPARPAGRSIRPAGLVLRDLVFTAVVPGAGGAYVPWLLLTRHGVAPSVHHWSGIALIGAGVVLYCACLWTFGAVGHGTPGVWDPPRRVVAAGPYRWVRNPIYLAALLIVAGEAWLLASLALLAYLGVLAVAFHLLVVGYEEPHLAARFGDDYDTYRAAVSRWVPRRPTSARPAGPLEQTGDR